MNILGDAANEPSIAVDLSNPGSIVIGWRQFDDVNDDFRQAGWGYSKDAGRTWTFGGVLTPGVFGSDPVLTSSADGAIYYLSINFDEMRIFRSFDGGASWGPKVVIDYEFDDKPWMAIDTTDSVGNGNIYIAWTEIENFTRSTNGGQTWLDPIESPIYVPFWGTLCVHPSGALYLIDRQAHVIRSRNAKNGRMLPMFQELSNANFILSLENGAPNPYGLMGQPWIVADYSNGPTHGYLYALSSACGCGSDDPLDVRFSRSIDGGQTWEFEIRVNDDPLADYSWQWFACMSVAPNGRIDAAWFDTRDDPTVTFSELYYSYSTDGGATWAPNVALSPPFNHYVGYPNGSPKLGDYFQIISDNAGVNIAYPATFNGEQDVWFLRVGPYDCNGNGTDDAEDVLQGASDCDNNSVPNECQADSDGDGNPNACQDDFDGDGILDVQDDDVDGDGAPNEMDSCPFTLPGIPVGPDGFPTGDANDNCVVNLNDYDYFQTCLSTGGPGKPAPHVCTKGFDGDVDGDVDFKDFQSFQLAFAPNGARTP